MKISACAIMANGKYVVLAFQDSCYIQSLEMKGIDIDTEDDDIPFGNPDLDGKVFDLKF